jgi:hypothetical protein
VREGYEGLVRGNSEGRAEKVSLPPHHPVHIKDESFMYNLRFGDGELLKDGTSDLPSGRSLKGRYIVRVGWDDVRGWFGVVSPDIHPIAQVVFLMHRQGWYTRWNCAFCYVSHTRRSTYGGIQLDQRRD